MIRKEYELRSRSRSPLKQPDIQTTPPIRRRSRKQSDEFQPLSLPTNRRKPKRILRKRFSDANAFRTAEAPQLEGILLFKERPRQFLLLFMGLGTVSYYSYTHHSQDFEQNVRSAIFSASFIFLSYCFLQTRDGLMVRPHPGVWRIVHGAGVLYLTALAALSVQNIDGARGALRILFPEVGNQTQPDMSHLNCDITAASVWTSISSIWFVAHVTGWWGKMCMFRDWRVCWVLSITFELLEMSLQFIIPDFKECWWDSLISDCFGANMIGMFLGRFTLQYLETKEYDWSGYKGYKYEFVLRALDQFSPFSWSNYHWEVFSSFKRFAQVFLILLVCLMAELNAFFLLSTLNIPKESHFNKLRLSLIFLLGLPSAAEYYEFISDPQCWRIGQNAWLLCSIVSFETLVWLKFLPELVRHSVPPPPEVYVPIGCFAVMFSTWMIIFFTRQTMYKKHQQSTPLDILFLVSFLPLLYLTKQWAY